MGRKVGAIAHCVYRPAQDRTGNERPSGWAEADWIAPDTSVYFPSLEKWMSDNGLQRRGACRVDTFLGMRERSDKKKAPPARGRGPALGVSLPSLRISSVLRRKAGSGYYFAKER